MTEGLDLRPRTVGELLDASFVVYRRLFWKFLIAVTLVSLPTLILSAAYAREAMDMLVDYLEFTLRSVQDPGGMGQGYWDEYWSHVGDSLVLSIGQTLLTSMSRGGGIGVMAVATWYVVRRQELPSAWRLVAEALPRLPAVILAHILFQQALGFVCACPPLGVVAAVLFLPASAAMMLERGEVEKRVRTSMERQGPVARGFKRLVLIPLAIAIDGTLRGFSLSFQAAVIGRGTLFGTFLFLFLSFFVSGVTAGAGALVPALGSESYGPIFWAQHYAEVVILPAVGVGATLWYLDLCARREGLDLLSEVGPAA